MISTLSMQRQPFGSQMQLYVEAVRTAQELINYCFYWKMNREKVVTIEENHCFCHFIVHNSF